jgi:hypothetical protein
MDSGVENFVEDCRVEGEPTVNDQSGAASAYRLYRMNALTGAILGFEDFEGYSDDQAIERVLGEAGERRIELWCGQRKVLAVSGRGGPGELTIGSPPEDGG